MKRPVSKLSAAVSALFAAVPALADDFRTTVTAATAMTPASPFMRVYGPAHAPSGFVRFCGRHPEDCEPREMGDIRFEPDDARMDELDRVNRSVNAMITPVTDLELYGVSEHWTYPTDGKGDCEDYALLKRRLLEMKGWPRSALLLTVVRDDKGEGHAVLTARTARGDFVLDNKVDDLKVWSGIANYRFLTRQSYLDPRVWVSIDPADAPRPQPAARPAMESPAPAPVPAPAAEKGDFAARFIAQNPLHRVEVDFGQSLEVPGGAGLGITGR